MSWVVRHSPCFRQRAPLRLASRGIEHVPPFPQRIGTPATWPFTVFFEGRPMLSGKRSPLPCPQGPDQLFEGANPPHFLLRPPLPPDPGPEPPLAWGCWAYQTRGKNEGGLWGARRTNVWSITDSDRDLPRRGCDRAPGFTARRVWRSEVWIPASRMRSMPTPRMIEACKARHDVGPWVSRPGAHGRAAGALSRRPFAVWLMGTMDGLVA
jgi:hypothetical protein